MITFVDRNGPPEAMTCPAVVCDECGEPIYAGIVEDAKGAGSDGGPVKGWVLWHTRHEAGRPVVECFHTVHGGPCDRVFTRRAECGDNGRHASRGLDPFLAQLAHNFAHPFGTIEDAKDVEDGPVEYVAPAPSGWRLRLP